MKLDETALAGRLKKMAGHLNRCLYEAEQANLHDALAVAMRLSVGAERAGAEALAAAGGPVPGMSPETTEAPMISTLPGRRRRRRKPGPGMIPPDLMSAISMSLLGSWTTTGPSETGGGLQSALSHPAEGSGLVPNVGMVLRPMLETVEKEIEPRVQARREAAVEAALTRTFG